MSSEEKISIQDVGHALNLKVRVIKILQGGVAVVDYAGLQFVVNIEDISKPIATK